MALFVITNTEQDIATAIEFRTSNIEVRASNTNIRIGALTYTPNQV